MTEQLITFDTAKLAKEKRFNIPTRHFYADISWKDEQIYYCNNVGYPEYTNDMGNDHGFGDITLIPTQSLLQKWLREIHHINVESNYLPNIQKYGCLYIPMSGKAKYSDIKYVNKKYYNTYEQALEVGLQEALKLIK
jgi:hypothetical protein